ncbi:MAG: hypothetical protein H6739_14690 [Alphaproteobacteria bacterium]|nr:hypothetical protein [Alphaproteobacteria bacterium]
MAISHIVAALGGALACASIMLVVVRRAVGEFRAEQQALLDWTRSQANTRLAALQQNAEAIAADRDRLRSQIDLLGGQLSELGDAHGALSSDALRLGRMATPKDHDAPSDPRAGISQAKKLIRLQFAALGAQTREKEQLTADLDQSREAHALTTRRFHDYRERTDKRLTELQDALDGRIDLATPTEAEVKARASEYKLRAARQEIEDLRTRLTFANRTIVALERQVAALEKPDEHWGDALDTNAVLDLSWPQVE